MKNLPMILVRDQYFLPLSVLVIAGKQCHVFLSCMCSASYRSCANAKSHMAPSRVRKAEGSAEEKEELTLFRKRQEGCKAQTELQKGRRTLVE